MSRLSQAETTAIAGALLGVPVLSPELQRLLDVKTDGNPFFLQEVVRSLYESGALERRGDTTTTRCTSMRRSPRAGRLVVQGGLTTGLVHALVAMDMPGPGTVFLSQKLEVHSARLHRRHDHCGSRSHLCASFETGDPVTRADHATRRHDRVGRRGVVFYVC
jgi:hypothetical protein